MSKKRWLRRGATALAFVALKSASIASIDRNIFDAIRAAEEDRGAQARARSGALGALPAGSVRRMAFVTFSYVKRGDASKVFDFILPAVDTWAAPSANGDNSTHPSLYVVFSQLSRGPFEELCVHGVGNISADQLSLCRHLEPIYVDCPEGKAGESPCCKQQEGLLELFENHEYPLYDWYAFFDDDIYLRKEYLARILPLLGPDPSFPMAAVPYNQHFRQVGSYGRYCANPRHHEQFGYPWGMPIFYSRGAVSAMAGGYHAGSLVKQCLAFDITHDVGNAMLNWMYSLPVAKLPPLNPLPDFRDDYIGSHWVGRDDMRELLYATDRVDRSGRVTKAQPKGAFSFHKTHERWTLPENGPPSDLRKLGVVSKEEARWYPNVTGFRWTTTYAQHGDPQSWERGVWHTMNLSDCNQN